MEGNVDTGVLGLWQQQSREERLMPLDDIRKADGMAYDFFSRVLAIEWPDRLTHARSRLIVRRTRICTSSRLIPSSSSASSAR